MKKATIAIRKKPTAFDAPTPTVGEDALARLLHAPAIGEAPAANTGTAEKMKGRQRRDTPRRRADVSKGEELVRLQVYLQPETHEALRVFAAKERRSLSHIVEEEVRDLMRRRGLL